jgi:hypothetical protein
VLSLSLFFIKFILSSDEFVKVIPLSLKPSFMRRASPVSFITIIIMTFI